MRFDGFNGPTYVPSAYSVDCQRAINWYTEKVESGKGKAPYALLRTPGRKLFADPGLGAGIVRGMWSENNHLFAVVNGKVMEVMANGHVSIYTGDVSNDGRPAYMTGNPDQLFIVSGNAGYIVSGAALQPITAPGFPARANGATFIDGLFVTARDGTQNFQVSDLNNGLNWDPAKVSDAEANPDVILAIGVVNNEFWPFGSQTTQVFDDTGDLDFPLQPQQNVVIETGIWAPNSLVNVAGSWYLIGASSRGRGMVLRMSSYAPARVSDHSVENAINKMEVSNDAIGWTYEENGHAFYVLYFPTANQTWVYDVSTDQWHQRTWLNPTTGNEEAHRGYCAAQCFGKVLVGDRIDGKIYEMSMQLLDDAGDLIRRTRIAPCVDEELQGVTHSNFVIDGNMGLGIDGISSVGIGPDDPMYDPQMMLQFSNDGGKTWSKEMWRGFGRVGQFDRRAIWRRMGFSRRRVYKAVVTAPADWGISAAYINMELNPGV